METLWNITEMLGSGPYPDSIVSPVDSAEMVFVAAGEFTRGITEEELAQIFMLEKDENPIYTTEVFGRSVYLSGFYIDRYPVTNYQYQKFVDETGHREPVLIKHPLWGLPMKPVVFVGWDDARTYARWAGKSIPSEDQWEKAARGPDRRWWSWGQEFLPDHCNSREYGLEHTSDIGIFDRGMSPYGCYDMCGNVWEICEGQWLEESLPMRGGCFLGSATFVRATCRWTPEDIVGGAHWLGFRCVKEVPVRQ